MHNPHCKICNGSGVIQGASYGGMSERLACDCWIRPRVISNARAFQLLSQWHGGQWCPLYAVQSSGLVESWSDLASVVRRNVKGRDQVKLLTWISFAARRNVGKFKHSQDGRYYYRVRN